MDVITVFCLRFFVRSSSPSQKVRVVDTSSYKRVRGDILFNKRFDFTVHLFHSSLRAKCSKIVDGACVWQMSERSQYFHGKCRLILLRKKDLDLVSRKQHSPLTAIRCHMVDDPISDVKVLRHLNKIHFFVRERGRIITDET